MDQPQFSVRNVSVLPDQIGIIEGLAIFLAVIAGYIDATGLIKWKTYVSFMSGNTTQLGTAFYNGNSGVIITSGTVIGCFVLGIYTSTCLSLWSRLRIKKMSFFIVSAILIIYALVSYYCSITPVLSIAIIGFAMGIMNTIVTCIGKQKVNTDFVTGTLNSMARNTAMFSMATNQVERNQYRANAFHLLFLWIGFLSGALAAPALLPLLGSWTLMLPALLLIFSALLIPNSSINP